MLNISRNSSWRLGLALTLPLTAVQAAPTFIINSFTDWNAALADGRVTAVSDSTFQDMVQNPANPWPDEYKNAQFYTPTLASTPDWRGTPALVMTWGGSTDLRQAAAWDYNYGNPAGEDLTNTHLKFSILPPVASTLFSVNLVDVNGNFREWIWHAGDAGEVTPGVFTFMVINDLITGASTYDPKYFFDGVGSNAPGPFDLTRVAAIRFDENIRWSADFPIGPGGQLPDGLVWNAWDSASVPEPSTYALILTWLMLTLAARRIKATS